MAGDGLGPGGWAARRSGGFDGDVLDCEISPASFAGVDDLDRIDGERPRTLMKAAGMASAA
jgi:hypothetical protein